ncbi:MAG: hypothetical protein KKB51_03690 [Candidatus Riflebacteria bacterium]|nr:hypothetical protein [Candidatus Riflebacteria bacterium]
MTTYLKQYLEKEKRSSWVPFFLLSCAIVFILSYRYLYPTPQLYVGYIKLEQASERGKPYVSFHLPENKPEHGFMVLLKDSAFNTRIEGMLDKKVEVKALLCLHEPADFDKIEIFEMKEVR